MSEKQGSINDDVVSLQWFDQIIEYLYREVKRERNITIQQVHASVGEKLCRLLSKERDLEYIFKKWVAYGGEAVVIDSEQVRPVKRRVAIKVAAPFLNKPGKRDIYKSGTCTNEYSVEERNEFFLRFTRGMRYQKEIAGAIDLKHGRIPKIYDVCESPLYFVMEYIPGPGFNEWVHNTEKKRRLNFLGEIFRLVDELHRCFVVHRDIKPNNFIVCQGKPVIIDFNIAKSLKEIILQDDTGRSSNIDDDTLVTQIVMGLGNKFYAAPEMLTDVSRADDRSDIYSCGKLLDFVHSQLPPIQGPGGGRKLPDPLKKIYLRATQFDMSKRYKCMSDMVDAYERALDLLDLRESTITLGEKNIDDVYKNFRWRNIAIPLHKAILDILNSNKKE